MAMNSQDVAPAHGHGRELRRRLPGALVALASAALLLAGCGFTRAGSRPSGAIDRQLGGEAPGIGFAIPSNTVRDIATQLIKAPTVTSSYPADRGLPTGVQR